MHILNSFPYHPLVKVVMPIPVLAQDVIDHILDVVGGSHPTRNSPSYTGLSEQALDLSACTLVSRAWLPHSSRLLLNHIFLENEACTEFIAAVQASPRLSQAITSFRVHSGNISIHDFFDEILDALPNLRVLVCVERHRFAFGDVSTTLWIQRISPNTRARLDSLSFSSFYPSFRWELKSRRCVEDERRMRLFAEGASAPEKPSLSAVLIDKVVFGTHVANALLYHIGCEVLCLELKDYQPSRGSALALRYCPRLESITLGPPSFEDYYDDVMQSLPAQLRRVIVVFDPFMGDYIIPRPRKYAFASVDWRAFAGHVQRCKSLEIVALVGLCLDVGRGAAGRERLFEERRAALLAHFPAEVAAIVRCWP
ncbi:hypothetical protein PsYK624_115120 [Phanerochaete sordida]|uniref:Uncharacterized protein n=1 Tax=Phanerochaete sordida TaxID=48140 RepID=A0A9P3GG09_9APHY|nr:hypothetical protein PsYK624_115120 [Phanerochaete sordida]